MVVLGGGLGGCAAALAITRSGGLAVVVEESPWVGGQLTSQAVPPDENAWIEEGGSTASYRSLRSAIRAEARRALPLNPSARERPLLNPGSGWVSRLCVEPRLAHRALRAAMAPALERGDLRLLVEHRLVAAEADRDRVRSVTVRSLRDGEEHHLEADLFLDATEEGDLLPLAGVEYVTGSEARAWTEEPGAPEVARPGNLQAVTWCCALEHRPGEDHVGDPPPGWERWRQYVPDLDPPWPGPLLSFEGSHPYTLEPRVMGFDPGAGTRDAAGRANLWTYRQILDPSLLEPNSGRHAASVLNWPQNDYLLGPTCTDDPDERERHRRGARELTLALVHWLRTEAPRPDGGEGWRGLAMAGDLVGTSDGLAQAVYVRESRRIRARTTLAEQHLCARIRMERTGKDRQSVRAEAFADSVGIGHYRIDLHPTIEGDNYYDVDALPFQIPLGCLLPVRVENVLPAAKNPGVTHITNGCTRLHPVEWNIGEAAGALAIRALRAGEPPAAFASGERLTDFQRELAGEGFLLEW